MAKDSTPHRVLIADDNEDAAETSADLLRLGGYEVVTAYDGQQAVDAANLFHPDVVFLDINMPVLDGYDAARELRRRHVGERRLFLVALTGRTDPADVARSAEAGFDRHLAKPVPGDALCVLVDTYMKNERSS